MYPVWTPDGRQVVTGNRLVDVRGGADIVVATPGRLRGWKFNREEINRRA